MRIGVRRPSIKKSIKARTTGKIKRSVNRAVNPLYGKRGMGLVNNPKRSIYNGIYNRTTIGVNDLITSSQPGSFNDSDIQPPSLAMKIMSILGIIVGVISALVGIVCIDLGGIIFTIVGVILCLIGIMSLKANKKEVEE